MDRSVSCFAGRSSSSEVVVGTRHLPLQISRLRALRATGQHVSSCTDRRGNNAATPGQLDSLSVGPRLAP
jgi:hypothetical protein